MDDPRLRLAATACLALAFLSAPLSAEPAGVQGAATAPREELIVAGRLENLTYDLADCDDLIGYGWITARLRVKRVLKGDKAARHTVLTVKYFAHNYLRDDRDLKLRLKKSDDGVYLICAVPGGIGVKCQ